MIGFYVVNKPTGANSTKMVSIAKRATKQKCGHLGTLDPMASGVLPIAVGKATKLFDWFLQKDKRYFAIGKFGVQTDTLDSEGSVQIRQEVDIQKQQIDQVLSLFKGEILQTPPLYSSISINGTRAYDLARKGDNFEVPSRKVHIYDIQCTQKIDKNLFAFELHCSAGTYVRSLILDIAKKLNTVATTVCIIRLSSGAFDLSMTSTPEEIENCEAKLIDIKDVIALPHLSVSEDVARRLLSGQTVILNAKNDKYLCYFGQKLIGIVVAKNNHIKIDINLWEDTND